MARPRKSPTIPDEPLRELARSLGFYALVEDWGTYREQPWLEQLLRKEEAERKRRSLERRIRTSRVGLFKSIADFDFSWPQRIDREQIQDLLTLQFLDDITNVILLGPTDQVTLCTTSPKPGIMGVSPVSLSQRGPFARELAISRASCTASVCRAAA